MQTTSQKEYTVSYLKKLYGNDKIDRLLQRPSQIKLTGKSILDVLTYYAKEHDCLTNISTLQYYILITVGNLDYSGCEIPKDTLALFSSRYVRPLMMSTEKERKAALLRMQITIGEYEALNKWDYTWKG